MAKRKRESSAASITPHKARKRVASKAEAQPPSQASPLHPHGEVDPEKLYKVRDIIDENQTKYLIAWEDDSESGEAYTPTWEPKKNANESAVAEWKERKAARKAREKVSSKPATTPARRGRGRPRKYVVHFTSSAQASPEPANKNKNGTETVDNDLPEIDESQQSPAANSTLSVFETPTSKDAGHSSPQSRTREPTVQVPDPPSSFDRGAYHRFDPRSSSNGTVSAIVDSSVPLPTISEVATPSPPHVTVEKATRVVPDSQSQGQTLEHSTFRGFSPTQQQQTVAEPNVVEGDNQRVDDPPEWTKKASQLFRADISQSREEDGNEVQASGGAERAESLEENHHTEAAQLPDNSAAAQIVAELESATRPSDPTPTPDRNLSDNNFSQPALNKPDTLETVLERQASAATSPIETRVATPQAQSQAQELEESPFNSQQASPSRINTQTSPRLEYYIVISAEDDPPSTLGLLILPQYSPPPAGQRPPPSSLLSEVVPQAQIANGIDTTINHTAATPASTQFSFPFETQQPFPTKVENETRPRAIFTQRIASPRSSSQIPSVPSQSIVAIGESAPARLVTPSPNSTAAVTGPANMESTSSTPVNPLLTQLNSVTESGKARRRARQSNTPAASAAGTGHAASAIPPSISAELVASQARQGNGGRSPSAVPASEPVRSVTKEEMRTSGRLPSLVALPHGAASIEHHDILTVSGDSRSIQDDPEQANVHVVPIAFGNIQRDQYKNGFQWYKGEIQSFLDGDDSPERFAKAETALDELRSIAIHPDLINSEAYSQPLSTPEQAQWDVDASCKFRFLRDLFDQLRSQEQDVHVVVAAKGNIIPEMLDNFLQTTGVPHTRVIERETPTGTGGLKVSIVDLDSELSIDRVERADLVVAMDGACNTQDPLLQAARRAGRGVDWAALLILVAPCTVEHIERSLLPGMSDTTRVRTLLKTALELQLQGVAGRLTASQASSKDAAIGIASYFAGPFDWSIEELGTIDNLDSQTETDIDQTNGDSSSAGKRSLEVDFDTATGNASKAPRGVSVEVDGHAQGTMPATINPQEIEITHISNSIGKATKSALDDFSSSSEVEQLRRILSEKQDELQEHVKAMSDLQYRHEEQHVELAKTKNERDQAIITAQNAVTRMSKAADQSAELRAERSELKELLAEANVKLLSHEIPDRRQFETLRLALEQEKSANEKAQKRTEQAQKDSEYSRELYQNTSSQARELVQQNADLEARLAHAEKLASGEQAKVQRATNDERNKLLAKENAKLKAVLKDRDAGMKFKDEEIARLKEAGRGRMGTRGSSVPRSPRMGSPALKGRSSRQTSPTMGEVKGRLLHPLRQC